MKGLKVILGLVAILIVLCMIAAVCLGVFVKPNDYKSQIEKAFNQKTHMILSLPGQLSWRFFPSFGMNAGQVDIAKTVHAKPFLSMTNVRVAIHPWSLLWGRVSHLRLSAESLGYNHMHFSHTDMTIKDLTSNQAFPFNMNTTARLGLPKPLHINLSVLVRFIPGKIRSLYFKNLKANLNKSDVYGQLSIEDLNRPHIRLNLSSHHFYVQDFVNLRGAEVPLSGLNMLADLKAQGTGAKHFPSTLNGTVKVFLKQTQIKGVDVGATLAQIRDAVKRISHQASSGINLAGLAQIQSLLMPKAHLTRINPNNGKVTQVGQFTVAGIVRNGVIQTHSMKIIGRHYNIEGSGSMDLNTKMLHYHFNLYGKHSEAMKGKTVQVRDDYVVPFFIKGHWDHLEKGINYPLLSQYIQNLLVKHAKNAALQTFSEKVGDHIPQGLKDKANNLLSHFLGQ